MFGALVMYDRVSLGDAACTDVRRAANGAQMQFGSSIGSRHHSGSDHTSADYRWREVADWQWLD